jgi:hypothetical protein
MSFQGILGRAKIGDFLNNLPYTMLKNKPLHQVQGFAVYNVK